MKQVKFIIINLLGYIIGFLIFVLLYATFKTILINWLGANETLSQNILEGFKILPLIYTIVFILYNIGIYAYNTIVVALINKELKIYKERSRLV